MGQIGIPSTVAMNYNRVLDAFFGHWYINLGVMLVLYAIGYLLYKQNVFSKTARMICQGAAFLIAFLWLMTLILLNAEYLGYGYPSGMQGMLLQGDRLYVVDYQLGGGGEGDDPMHFCRIHIMDPRSGEKLRRIATGDEGDLFGSQGDSLIFHAYLDTKIFSASTGRTLATWNSTTLPEIFPELASGIDNTMINTADKLLELTTRDGNHWDLSLETGRLSAELPSRAPQSAFVPSTRRYIHNQQYIEMADRPGNTTVLQLSGIGGMQEIRYLMTDNDSVTNPNLSFLLGEFIALSEPQQCLVVLSYATTDKTGFLLTGVSLDGRQKLWELRQSALRPQDAATDALTYAWACDQAQGVLYFGMRDEVMAITMASGKQLWRVAL